MPEKKLEVKIVTPSEKLYEGAAESLTYPGVVGEGQILPGHAPITSRIGRGTLAIDRTTKFEVDRGVISVDEDRVEGLIRRR